MTVILLVVASCSYLKENIPEAESGNYIIDSDGEGDLEPFLVYCNMTEKNGVGVTVISHDSENRTKVKGYENPGTYTRMLTTLEHVYLSWPVSPKSPHTVSSLSSTSVTARFCLVTTIQTAGGCHVILLR